MSSQGILYNIQRMSTKDGPGLRTTVFFKGCPLRCRWCSNPESQRMQPQHMHFAGLCTSCGACLSVCSHGAVTFENGIIGRDLTRCVSCGACAEICPSTAASMSGKSYGVDEVMKVVLKDAAFYFNSGGGVTFGGGECTMQGAFLLELMDACLAKGLHTCVDTCGQTDPALFRTLLDRADLFLYDIKHMDSAMHKELTGIGNGRIQENLKTGLSLCPEKFLIRVPLMPGLNDSETNIAAMASLLHEYGVSHVDVMPCHSFGKSKYEALRLAQPGVPEYEPEQLAAVLQRFAAHGLETEIV